MPNLGAWTRGDVLDLHIFILLCIWFTLDRSNIYFIDILQFLRNLTAGILFPDHPDDDRRLL